MNLLTAEQLEVLSKQPVPGGSPGGSNVRLESAFEAIEQEIAKLDSLTAEDPVRWREVHATAQEILQQQSKDFLVVCYLTRALCETHVIDGLQQGLLIANGLVENFWEHAYPPVKRLRGRAQAFEWLVEKSQPLLEKYQPSVAHLDRIKALEASVIALDNTLMEKMAEAAPNLADFRQRFRRMRQALEMEQQAAARRGDVSRPVAASSEQPAESTATSLHAPVAVASIPVPGSVAAEKDIVSIYRAVQDPLRSVSQFLRSKKLTDPEAYRINRFVTWLGISLLPPATDGKTQLKPVPRDKVTSLHVLFAGQRWQELLPELESSLSRAPYWLDGQRWACEALQGLNADDAAVAVKEGVRAFVARFPAVVQYSFSDGTPFADEQTRQWINRDVINRLAASQSGVTVDTAGLSSRWLDAYEQATTLAQQKKFRDALQLFQEGCAQSTSLREQTLWRFSQARFCFDHGLLQLALPLLETLDQQLMEKGLDQWEPHITTKILELLLRCYQSIGNAAVPEARIEILHARLCKLDLALAFDLSKH